MAGVADLFYPSMTDPYSDFPKVDPKGRAKWAKRADGSAKGDGFLGVRQRPDGTVSSEISVGFKINGKEQDIPLMVPGLTREEMQFLMTTPTDVIAKKLPQSIKEKALAHAQKRIAQGLSPFAQPGE